jgi:hypothetical protein
VPRHVRSTCATSGEHIATHLADHRVLHTPSVAATAMPAPPHHSDAYGSRSHQGAHDRHNHRAGVSRRNLPGRDRASCKVPTPHNHTHVRDKASGVPGCGGQSRRGQAVADDRGEQRTQVTQQAHCTLHTPGQSSPARQCPAHKGEDCPVVLPNRPAAHGPLQLAKDKPATSPYRPAKTHKASAMP